MKIPDEAQYYIKIRKNNPEQQRKEKEDKGKENKFVFWVSESERNERKIKYFFSFSLNPFESERMLGGKIIIPFSSFNETPKFQFFYILFTYTHFFFLLIELGKRRVEFCNCFRLKFCKLDFIFYSGTVSLSFFVFFFNRQKDYMYHISKNMGN